MLRLREEGRDAIESAKCQRCLLGEILQVLMTMAGTGGKGAGTNARQVSPKVEMGR
jgi:hypothetical protein